MSKDVVVNIRANRSQYDAEMKKAADEARAISRRTLTDAEVNERAKRAILADTNRQRIADEKAAMAAQQNTWGTIRGNIDTAKAAVMQFGGAMFGLGSAAAVFAEINNNFTRARENAYASVKLVNDYRGSLLELAALKGQFGATGAEMASALKFQAKTGQTTPAALAMQTSFLGAAEASIDKVGFAKKISRTDATAFLESIGQMQAVEGGDATAYGKFGAMLLNSEKGRPTVQGLKDKASSLFAIAQPGGFTWSSAINQYGELQAYVNTGMLTEREAMAMLSGFSINEPDKAGTRVDQLVRGTVGALGKDRRVKGPEGSDSIGTATYLQGLGAREGMKPYKIADLVRQDVNAQRGLAGRQGRDFDPYVYLQGKGYGDVEALKAVIGFGGLMDNGMWGQTFEPMLTDPNLGKEYMGQIRTALNTDEFLQSRMSEGAAQTASMLGGIGKNEQMTTLRKAAWARMKGSGKYAGLPGFDELERTSVLSPMELTYGYKGKMDEEMRSMLLEGAQAAGVETSAYKEADTVTHGFGPPRKGRVVMSDDEALRISAVLGSRGQSPVQETNTKLAEAAGSLLEASKNFKEAAVRSANAPMVAAPVQPPAAPGGR